MQAFSPQPLPTEQPMASPLPAKQPKSGRKLLVLLIVAIVAVLAAAGFVAWLFMSRGSSVPSLSTPPDDTKNVKSVTLVAPAALPTTYAAANQTADGVIRVHYYDNATNCGMTVTVVPAVANKTAKDTIVDAVNAAYADGITTTKSTNLEKVTLKEAGESGKSYDFDVVELEQSLAVPGIAFAGQVNAIAYKQFGQQIAGLSHSCKTETWASKKVELADWVKAFTIKTER